jgi:hypothetical protein
VSKIPKFINHLVRINVAPGNYDGSQIPPGYTGPMFDFSGFVTGPAKGNPKVVISCKQKVLVPAITSNELNDSINTANTWSSFTLTPAVINSLVDAGFGYVDGGLIPNSLTTTWLHLTAGPDYYAGNSYDPGVPYEEASPIISNTGSSIVSGPYLFSAGTADQFRIEANATGFYDYVPPTFASGYGVYAGLIYNSSPGLEVDVLGCDLHSTGYSWSVIATGGTIRLSGTGLYSLYGAMQSSNGGYVATSSAEFIDLGYDAGSGANQSAAYANANSSASVFYSVSFGSSQFTQTSAASTVNVYYSTHINYGRPAGCMVSLVNGGTFTSSGFHIIGSGGFEGAYCVTEKGDLSVDNLIVTNYAWNSKLFHCNKQGLMMLDLATIDFHTVDGGDDNPGFVSINSTPFHTSQGSVYRSKGSLDGGTDPDWSLTDVNTGCTLRYKAGYNP